MYWVNICNLRWARFFFPFFLFFCSFRLMEATFLLGELAHLDRFPALEAFFSEKSVHLRKWNVCTYCTQNIWAWASAWLHTKSVKGCNWMWMNTKAFMEEQSKLQEHSYSINAVLMMTFSDDVTNHQVRILSALHHSNLRITPGLHFINLD